jgi:hypothetical protein
MTIERSINGKHCRCYRLSPPNACTGKQNAVDVLKRGSNFCISNRAMGMMSNSENSHLESLQFASPHQQRMFIIYPQEKVNPPRNFSFLV